MSGWQKVCPGCISGTVRCRKSILDKETGWGGGGGGGAVGVQHHGVIWFNLAVVTLNLKTLTWAISWKL